MDYHSIHGHDLSSFDIPTTHRLPTVQASQALDNLQDSSGNLYISTGLRRLDDALLLGSVKGAEIAPVHGGVKRGQVTEIWGPPGTGRTSIAIQLAARSVHNSDNVIWVDCFQELQFSRLEDALRLLSSPAAKGSEETGLAASNAHDKFIHFSCLTLPHLMALISRPNNKAIPERVALVVLSNLSALINSWLPKGVENTTGFKTNKGGQSASVKRRQGLQSIIGALQKLAATKNCAVVLLSQCATKMQSEHGATLVPAVSAAAWNEGISTRIVMFRDWAWQGGKLVSVFLAGLQKLDGKSNNDAIEYVAAFRIDSTGVSSVEYDAANMTAEPALATRKKRKLDETDHEVPDSEDDEDYGWAEEDESMLPQPPQWQGSEDILLGQDLGRSDDEREDDCESTHSILSEVSY